MPPPTSVPIETLLAQRAWMRSLARSLVRDESAADDLAQEVFVDALRSPPAHGAGVRGWLATLLRRRARDAWRSASRRAAREEAAARPEAMRSAAEVVAEADLHRRVVEAVMGLEEPFRGTLLLRFYEDRSPAAVAEAQGVPAATVHSRIRRGIERLRARLDGGTPGGRGAWMAALLPLAGLREGSMAAAATAAAGGGALVGTKMVVAAGVLGAAAGTLVTGFAAGTLGGGGAAPVGEAEARAEVAALRARLEAIESRAAAVPGGEDPAPAGRSSREGALEDRVRSIEARLAAGGGPSTIVEVPDLRGDEEARRRALEAMEKGRIALAEQAAADARRAEGAEEMRRKVCDTTLPVQDRTAALTGLRFVRDGINEPVLAAAIELFGSGIEPGFREVILRDLHKIPDERLKRLYLDALAGDPEPRVRRRAAEDIDTWKEDPEVRLALERARDGDVDEEVRKIAAR
jgi:RNA polymerase sigma-70 factor (ECF subfamily)